MSEFKGTPGPWEVCNGIDVYPVGDTKARFYVADCDPDNAPLGSIFLEAGEHPKTDATYEIARANACLIAAAPELLEALQAFVALVDDETIRVRPSDKERLMSALGDGYAAIAKATGK